MFTNAIPKNLYPLLSDYAKILIPSFITYLVTRYSLNRPHKYEIRNKQFNLVYLPLYRLTKQLLTPERYKENISIYIRKVDKIIYKNYQYVFPKTLKLYERLKKNWETVIKIHIILQTLNIKLSLIMKNSKENLDILQILFLIFLNG